MAANLFGSLIGLPIALSTQAPLLARNARQNQELQRIQEQGGAGAIAARQSADQAARDAVSIAGGGNTASGGLNLRTGLQAAENARRAGAGQASAIAAQEGLAATRALRANDIARRQFIGRLGAGTAGALAQGSAQGMAAQDTGPASQVASTAAPVAVDPVAAVAGVPQDGSGTQLSEVIVGPGPGLDELDAFGNPLPAAAPVQAAPAVAQAGTPQNPIELAPTTIVGQAPPQTLAEATGFQSPALDLPPRVNTGMAPQASAPAPAPEPQRQQTVAEATGFESPALTLPPAVPTRNPAEEMLSQIDDQLARILDSSDARLLQAQGMPDRAILDQLSPELVRRRDAARMEMIQGTGSGQTLQGVR